MGVVQESCVRARLELWTCHLCHLRSLADPGGALLMGPNSFGFLHVFAEKRPRRTLVPPPTGLAPAQREIRILQSYSRIFFLFSNV